MASSILPTIPSPVEVVPILKECALKFQRIQKHLIETVTIETACFDNVVRPWAQVADEVNTDSGMIWLLMYAAPDEATHEAILAGAKLFNEAHAKLTASRELFLLFEAVANKNEPLDEESRHLVQIRLHDFISAGHGSLSVEALPIYTKNKSTLGVLQQEYMKNLQQNEGGIWAKLIDLDGIPEEEKQKWKRTSEEHPGEVFIPFAGGGSTAVLTYAEKEHLREKMSLGEESRLPANIPLFRETVLLRYTQARLMGYRNHAEFRIQKRAIQSIEYLHGFLSGLQDTLVPLGQQEIRQLQELRVQDRKAKGIYNNGDENVFPPWDAMYYKAKLLKTSGVDDTVVASYFPLEHTVIAMLHLFEEFLDLRFSRIPLEGLTDHNIWHETVEVWEARKASSNRFIGFLYLDLLMRERKYKGSQNMNIHCGYEKPDGSRQMPATVLMTAFPPPADNSCVQLKHSQVVTLFHELGHGIHDLVSQTKYSRFHGTRLPVDIGEMPSTLLENWCWEKDILKSLSCHYSKLNPRYAERWSMQNPGEDMPPQTIPDELLDSIIRNRNSHRALYHLHQLTVSKFDLMVHGVSTHKELEDLDFAKIWYDFREELEGQDFSKFRNGGHDYVTFGHLINGYDVGYYGYLCCAAFAKDAYLSHFKPNPRDKDTWKRFHDKILRYGGSHPNQLQMLEGFLGREPNLQALAESLSS